ncbi:MAG: hypothetical protein U1E53_27825 [Dongiaceae bacterium]
MDQSVASLRSETLTARLRRRFPARYLRKDARTLALRLACGPQSKLTLAVVAGPGERLAGPALERERERLHRALALTGYDRERCRGIAAAFERRHAPPGEG